MQFTQGKNPTCFNCFGIGILSNFDLVKCLRNFGGCLVDHNIFLSSLFLILSKQLLNFLKLILWFGL